MKRIKILLLVIVLAFTIIVSNVTAGFGTVEAANLLPGYVVTDYPTTLETGKFHNLRFTFADAASDPNPKTFRYFSVSAPDVTGFLSRIERYSSNVILDATTLIPEGNTIINTYGVIARTRISRENPGYEYIYFEYEDGPGNHVKQAYRVHFADVAGEEITVNHFDLTNNVNISTEKFNGFRNKSVSANIASDPKYYLDPQTQTTSFVFSAVVQNATINYRIKQAGLLTIEHRDNLNNTVLFNEVVDTSAMLYGDTYTPQFRTITGYSSFSGPANVPITLTDMNQSIVLLYSDNSTPVLNNYTVQFNTNSTEIVNPQTVLSGAKATKPTDPVRIGFMFDGWYADSNLTNAFDFTSPINQNLTLYAKWIPNQVPPSFVTVAFETNGGSSVASQSINLGDVVAKPQDPYRNGYSFVGWFSNSTLTDAYDFNQVINQNLTLYAKWNKIINNPESGSQVLPNTGIENLNLIWLFFVVGGVMLIKVNDTIKRVRH